jgi:hypothetical protein
MDFVQLEQELLLKFDGPVRLSSCEVIVDIKKFVTSHIDYLKGNTGNKAYMSYYRRLMKLKNM